MITLERMAYEVKHTLRKLGLTDDVNDMVLYDKLSGYMELLKQAKYADTRTVQPEWLIHTGKVLCANVNSGDDPTVPNGSVVFARCVLPRMLSLGGRPYFRVMNGLRTQELTYIQTFDLFYQIYRTDRSVLERNPCYVLMNNRVYAYPNKAGLNLVYAPADARDCLIKRELVSVAVGMPAYTATEERMFTVWDELPVDGEISRRAILETLTKDFGVTMQMAEDHTQNATDED